VNISRPALQAVLSADTALDPTQVTAGHNSFTLTANGQPAATITLPLQTYSTAQAVVQALQAQINGNSQVGGLQIGVGLVGGVLTFTSGGYGSSATIGVSGAGFLGFNSAKNAQGQDVAGTFVVGGHTESATGSGQVLTGNSGNANTDGLAVRVPLLGSHLNADPTVPEASLTVTRGLASQLGDALDGLLDVQTGQLQTIDQNFQDQIGNYQKTIDQLTQEYTTRQDQLTQEFTQLETTVSNLKNAGGFLSAQTAALQSLTSGSSSSSSSH
jgi:flagellar hook-associated protein 2